MREGCGLKAVSSLMSLLDQTPHHIYYYCLPLSAWFSIPHSDQNVSIFSNVTSLYQLSTYA